MENNLIPRENDTQGYFSARINGRDYSVVDFGTTMKTHPMPAGIYMGWEAIPIKADGGLDSNEIYRAGSWEDLEKELESL